MSFVNAHIVAYITDLGYSSYMAAGTFSLIGACAILGALVLGHLSDRHGRRSYLSFSYGLRCVGFVLVLLSMGIPLLNIPAMGLATLITGIVLVGLSWNAVVALTAAFASDRFGIRNLGTIYGTMFAVMPLGSGFGAALGGFLYDARGTYDLAIWSNLVLLVISVVLVLSIHEKRGKPGLPQGSEPGQAPLTAAPAGAGDAA